MRDAYDQEKQPEILFDLGQCQERLGQDDGALQTYRISRRFPSSLACPLAQHEQVQAFDLLPRPRRPTQELQAGADARVAGEAANADLLAKLRPSKMRDQISHDLFEGDPMKRIASLRGSHLRRTSMGHERDEHPDRIRAGMK